MTDVFDKIPNDRESIILNEIALSYDFIPKEIPHRENENHYIATCIKPLMNNRNGKNLFIFGTPGIGKTLAVKSVFREMSEKGIDEEVRPIYINCWKYNTPYKITLEICRQIEYKFTHNKTIDQLITIIGKQLSKKSAVICLDECDKFSDQEILYNIFESIFRKTIILITNEKNWINNLDPRIKSRLIPELLEFKPYNYKETYDILKKRSEYAFIPNTANKDVLTLIAEETFKFKDIRTGIYLLKEAAELAESKLRNKILKEDVKTSLSKLDKFKIKSSKELEKKEDELLNLIKENSGKTARDLFKLYNKDISYKTFRRRLEDLRKANLIYIEEQFLGAKGKVSIVNYGSLKRLSEF